jgi:hypothetical protein
MKHGLPWDSYGRAFLETLGVEGAALIELGTLFREGEENFDEWRNTNFAQPYDRRLNPYNPSTLNSGRGFHYAGFYHDGVTLEHFALPEWFEEMGERAKSLRQREEMDMQTPMLHLSEVMSTSVAAAQLDVKRRFSQNEFGLDIEKAWAPPGYQTTGAKDYPVSDVMLVDWDKLQQENVGAAAVQSIGSRDQQAWDDLQHELAARRGEQKQSLELPSRTKSP